MTTTPSALDKLMEKMLGDMGASMSAALIVIGDRLGLYRALGEGGPMTPAMLAEKTGTTERYIREWLAAQAASGYVTYSTDSKQYSLSPEQKMVFADEGSPTCIVGAYDVVSAVFDD